MSRWRSADIERSLVAPQDPEPRAGPCFDNKMALVVALEVCDARTENCGCPKRAASRRYCRMRLSTACSFDWFGRLCSVTHTACASATGLGSRAIQLAEKMGFVFGVDGRPRSKLTESEIFEIENFDQFVLGKRPKAYLGKSIATYLWLTDNLLDPSHVGWVQPTFICCHRYQ